MDIIHHGMQRTTLIPLESELICSNIVMITEEINAESVTNYQQQLLYLKNVLKEGDTITLWINSPGGSVYDGLGLYDLIQIIKESGIKVQTINAGACCSFAALLLMCGTPGLRFAFKNSSTMVHEISSWTWGKTLEVEDYYREIKRLQDAIDNIITKHSSAELIELCKRKDLWLNAKDAIKYNIIDSIKEN